MRDGWKEKISSKGMKSKKEEEERRTEKTKVVILIVIFRPNKRCSLCLWCVCPCRPVWKPALLACWQEAARGYLDLRELPPLFVLTDRRGNTPGGWWDVAGADSRGKTQNTAANNKLRPCRSVSVTEYVEFIVPVNVNVRCLQLGPKFSNKPLKEGERRSCKNEIE